MTTTDQPTPTEKNRASALTDAEVADQQPRLGGDKACSNPACPLRYSHRGPCAPITDQPTPRVGDTITTAAQLDALPVGTVVVEGDHTTPDEGQIFGITTIPGVFHRFPDGWYVVAGHGARDLEEERALPATVLYRPDAPHPAPDGDAVERAARAVMVTMGCAVRIEDADCPHVDDSMPCRCETRFSICVEHDGEPQPASVTVCPYAERMARAALAAAGVGEAECGHPNHGADDHDCAPFRGGEALDLLANARNVRTYGDYGAGWRDGVRAGADLAARGAAVPTEIQWGRRFADGTVVPCTEDEARPPSGAVWVGVRRTVSEWQEAQG